jgi:glycosyltransferase involved in cell wall biosynthesis
MTNPILSIITINLNNATGLEKTIQSVVEQNFQNYEFIIVDGKSSDNSVDIIKKYQNSITTWKSENDSGVYEAMNKGIKLANGKYLQFLNSGDYLLNNEILSTVFSTPTIEDILYGSSIRKSDDNKLYEVTEPKNLTFKRFYDYSTCHQAMFIKRDLFNKLGLYNEKLKIVADWEFNIKSIIFNNCTLKYLDFPIVYYDMSGISFRNQKLSINEKNQILNELLPPRILEDYANNHIKEQPNVKSLKNKIANLQNDLTKIQTSKFYKLWQSYNQILKNIGLKKFSN